MFWCLLSQFMCGKSERNNKYLNICWTVPSNYWKQKVLWQKQPSCVALSVLNIMQIKGITHDTFIVTVNWAIAVYKLAMEYMCFFKKRGLHQADWQHSNTGVFCNWHACPFYNRCCYLLSGDEKLLTLDARVDISHLRDINIKKTLSNKRN